MLGPERRHPREAADHRYHKPGECEPPEIDSPAEAGHNHDWFTGFAGPRGSALEVVVAVLIEHDAHGSNVAPLGAKAAEFYLDRLHPSPLDPAQTLTERLMRGVR
jgi:hypothetical protein